MTENLEKAFSNLRTAITKEQSNHSEMIECVSMNTAGLVAINNTLNEMLQFLKSGQKTLVEPFSNLEPENLEIKENIEKEETKEEIIELKNFDLPSSSCFKLSFVKEKLPSEKDKLFEEIENLENLNVSFISDFNSMLKNFFPSQIKNLSLSKWNVSRGIDFENFLSDNQNLQTIDLSNWNSEKAVSFKSMFENCKFLKELEIENINMPNLKNVENLFKNCLSLKELNLSKWASSNIEKCVSMFENCKSLETLDLSNWNFPSLDYVFKDCSSLKNLSLAKCSISENCQQMDSTFSNCSSLVSLDLSSLNLTNVISFHRTFYNCRSLKNLKWGGSLSENLDLSYLPLDKELAEKFLKTINRKRMAKTVTITLPKECEKVDITIALKKGYKIKING